MTKRWSRGYAPALIEELDLPITGAALQLLLRLRRDSDMRETDGSLTKRQLDALAVAHGISKSVKRRALSELVSVGLVHQTDTGFTDLHFDQWCRTSAERKNLREKWNAAKREPKSSSTVESTRESTRDSTRTASASASVSESVSESESAAMVPAAASSEVSMPTQDASITVTKTWEEIVGRQATIGEINHVGWILNQYNRLTAPQIADEMRRIVARPRQEPIHQIGYFDSPLRELNDTTTPSRRPSIVRGEGEPPEDLSIPDWEAAGAKA